MDESPSPRSCEHCQRTRPGRWSLIECYPARTYEWLCRSCARQQDRELTAAAAIDEACLFVTIVAGLADGTLPQRLARYQAEGGQR